MICKGDLIAKMQEYSFGAQDQTFIKKLLIILPIEMIELTLIRIIESK